MLVSQRELDSAAGEVGCDLVVVDPRRTLLECPAVGHLAEEDRLTLTTLECQACGLEHADVDAAKNLLGTARVLRLQPVAGWETDPLP